MTILEEALEIATVLEDGKWRLGEKLLEGLEQGEFTIREFALLRDKSYDREDSYSNYSRAAKFKFLCSEIPDFNKLLKLPISYHYEAMKAIDAGMDIEDILDLMYQSAYDGDGNELERYKGVRWFQSRTKKTQKGVDEIEQSLVHILELYIPLITGRKEAMAEGEARLAWRKSKLAKLLYNQIPRKEKER